jgi:hypothetical protein
LGVVEFGWQVVGVGDYDGNRIEDVMWRHATTGEVGFWSMEESRVANWISLGHVGHDWVVV